MKGTKFTLDDSKFLLKEHTEAKRGVPNSQYPPVMTAVTTKSLTTRHLRIVWKLLVVSESA